LCPARQLFESAEVHEVAAENLLQVGKRRRLLEGRPDDRKGLQVAVAAGFRKISAQLEVRAPALAGDLDRLQLSELQKDAVVDSMRLISMPEVQSIGLVVARAIRDSGCIFPECVRQHVEAKLRPRLTEIRRLREELVPVSLRQLWGGRHQWDLTLDPANIRSLESVNGKFAGDGEGLEVIPLGSSGRHHLSPAERSSVVSGGIMEEARALMDAVKLCARMVGRELDVSPWATSLGGTWMNFGLNLESCGHDAGENVTIHFAKEFFCPLKFGAQGLDALRAAAVMPAEESRPDGHAVFERQPRATPF
jgi:hypothetical protein